MVGMGWHEIGFGSVHSTKHAGASVAHGPLLAYWSSFPGRGTGRTHVAWTCLDRAVALLRHDSGGNIFNAIRLIDALGGCAL